MAALVWKHAFFPYSTTPFVLFSSPLVAMDFSPLANCTSKMVDLEIEIKNKGEMNRHKTQGNFRVCEKEPSHNSPQFKNDADVKWP